MGDGEGGLNGIALSVPSLLPPALCASGALGPAPLSHLSEGLGFCGPPLPPPSQPKIHEGMRREDSCGLVTRTGA